MKSLNDLMKSISLKRLIALTFSYLLISLSIFSFFSQFSILDRQDFVWFSVILLPFILLPLYIIFYKRTWIKNPAKIIFLILAVILLYYSLSFIEDEPFDWLSLIFLSPLFLAIASLSHLYKNDLKNWITFLRSKPFFSLKNRLEISRQDILLFILSIVIIHLVDWNNIFIEKWFDGIVIYPALISILIPAYIFLKRTPLKSVVKVLLISVSTLFLFRLIYWNTIYWNTTYWQIFEGGLIKNILYYRFEFLTLIVGVYAIFFSRDNNHQLKILHNENFGD